MPNYSFSVSPDNQVYELNITMDDGRTTTRRFAAMNYRSPSDVAILVNSVLRHYQSAVVANLDAANTNVLPSITEIMEAADMGRTENAESSSSVGRRVRPSMMENRPRHPRTSSTRRQEDYSMDDNDTPRSPDSKRRRF